MVTQFTVLLQNISHRFDFNEKSRKYKLNGELTQAEFDALSTAIHEYIKAQAK